MGAHGGTRSGAVLVAVGVAVAMGALLSRSAGALPFFVEDWSITAGAPGGPQSSFSDDFEDESFASGFYLVPCGSVEPGDESGGSLALAHPAADPPCAPFEAEVVAAQLGFSGSATVLAEYDFATPGLDAAYGIQISNMAGTDFVYLNVATNELGTFVAAVDETFTGEDLGGILGFTLAPLSADTIEFQLSVEPSAADPDLLVPSAAFSIDSGSFTPLSLDGGTLDAAASTTFGGTLTAVIPEPATAFLLGAGLVGLGAARRREARG